MKGEKKDKAMRRIFSSLSTHVFFFLLTALIIMYGLFLPRMLLSSRSSSDAVISGRINAEQIQPYGADIKLKEQYISAAVQFLEENADQGVAETGDDLDNYFFFSDNCESIPLGMISWSSENDGYDYPVPQEGFELTSAIMEEIETDLHTSFDGSYGLQMVDSTGYAGYGYAVNNERGLIFMEGHTGLPVYINIKFRSPDHGSLEDLSGRLASLYSEMSGIRFVEVLSDYSYYEAVGRDIHFNRVYRSADRQFLLHVGVQSGLYFTPVREGDTIVDWVDTYDYVWTVSIFLEEV